MGGQIHAFSAFTYSIYKKHMRMIQFFKNNLEVSKVELLPFQPTLLWKVVPIPTKHLPKWRSSPASCVRSLCPPVSQAQQLGSNKIFRQDVYVVYVLGEFVGIYFDCWINNNKWSSMTIWLYDPYESMSVFNCQLNRTISYSIHGPWSVLNCWDVVIL